MRNKVTSASEAAALVPDGATLGTIGGGGGLVEADALLAAIEDRFLTTGSPTGLRIIHSLGIGDRDRRGLNRLAYEGLVRKVIGGHWIWSPRMQALAKEEKIEAYVLPAGVTAQLMREIGAGRAGLITHVGLGTFVDPRLDGGRMNRSAQDTLVELIEIDGRTLLRYKPFPVHVALLRGSYADPDGNVSQEEEPANLEAFAMALAAHNSGGVVIVQVRGLVEHGQLPARSVRIPGALVDAVVVVPDQPQCHAFFYDPSISGERRAFTAQADTSQPAPTGEGNPVPRALIAHRAAQELFENAVINFGFGIPDGVAKLVDARGETDRYYQTIEHGTYGGSLLDGVLFGFARNASCMIDSPSQFDFYGGGGLDIAFLGFGEMDASGNVNVSRLGGTTVGPGGFIDIAQNARKVVFCGTFEAKGVVYAIDDQNITIERYGQVRKLVQAVDQITFSGQQALASGQQVLCVTERAVFELTEAGMCLRELAPGIDLRADVLERMDFAPIVPSEIPLMPLSTGV
jgi:acyl CoA:acetate/3-ketoacid CoA transferase